MLYFLKDILMILISVFLGSILGNKRNKSGKGRGDAENVQGREIAAPASGEVTGFQAEEGRRNLFGAVIQSERGLVYAPEDGKILKIDPAGNKIVLQTEEGFELLIEVGKSSDRMLRDYYRTRVIKNEIVHKGKVIMEYDRERMLREHKDIGVYVSLHAPTLENKVILTEAKRVLAGDRLLWVM